MNLRTGVYPVTVPFSRSVLTYLVAGALGIVSQQSVSAQGTGKAAAKGALWGALIGGAIGGIVAASQYDRDRDFLVKPRPVDFGSVRAGASSEKTITVVNRGKGSLRITRVAIRGSSFTLVKLPELPIGLQVGGVAELTVRFAPPTPGAGSGVIEIERTKANKKGLKKEKLDLKGRGVG